MARVVELGADVDERDSIHTIGYECHGTPLLRAIKKGKTDAVRFLLEKGAGTTARGYNGETAMEMVKEHWVVDEIRKMVEEVGETEDKGTKNKQVIWVIPHEACSSSELASGCPLNTSRIR